MDKNHLVEEEGEGKSLNFIEQIIEEIEEYIDGCKYQALSSSKIIVNKDEL